MLNVQPTRLATVFQGETKVPEPSTYDRLMELLSPVPKAAEAAPWKSVLNMMSKYVNSDIGSLDKNSLKALEYLTEEYPAVLKSNFSIKPSGTGSKWIPPNMQHMYRGKWATGESPVGYGQIIIDPLEEGLFLDQLKKKSSMPLSYAHEASHVLGGEPLATSVDDLKLLQSMGIPYPATRVGAVGEGFAEGVSHGLLDRYNRKSLSTYWPMHYKDPKGPNSLVTPYYIGGGQLGVDIGSDIRRGSRFDPQSILDALYEIINSHK